MLRMCSSDGRYLHLGYGEKFRRGSSGDEKGLKKILKEFMLAEIYCSSIQVQLT
jgi:hypothetical protein